MYEKTVGIIKNSVDHECEITMDSSLVEDIGVNSIEIIMMVTEFEKEFNIEIPDGVIPTLHTVKDIVNYLEKNVA